MSRPSADRYDGTTIALHWIIAFGVVFQWLGAHVIDWFPKGPLKVDARSVHIVVGALLVVAVGYRVGWRTTQGVRMTLGLRTWRDRVASAVHVALYGLMTAALLLGLFNSWVRGDDLFGLMHIPMFGTYDVAARHALANRVVGLHRLAANLLLGLAAAHAGAGLVHYIILRDGVLNRMLPLRPRVPRVLESNSTVLNRR